MKTLLFLFVFSAFSVINCEIPIAQQDFDFSINDQKVDVLNRFNGFDDDFRQANWTTDVYYTLGHRSNRDPLLFEFQGRELHVSAINATMLLTYPTPDVDRNWIITAVETVVGQFPTVSQQFEVVSGAINTRNISLAFQYMNNLRVSFSFRVYGRR